MLPRQGCPSRPRRSQRARAPGNGRSRQRYVVVLAQTLQDEERRRGVAAVCDEVRSARRDHVHLTGAEAYFLPGIAEEEPKPPFQDVERVLDGAVIVPGDLLARGDLKLGDAKSCALGMASPSLDLVQMARVLHAFHDGLLGQPLAGASAWTASSKT